MKNRFFALVFAAVVVSACSTTSTPAPLQFAVSVSGLAASSSPTAGTYVLVPGSDAISAEPLQFREFAGYVHHVMKQRGFSVAPNDEAADVVIFMTYGVDPASVTVTRSQPIYTSIPGRSSTVNLQSLIGGSFVNTTATVQSPPVHATSRQLVSETLPGHFRFVVLDAWRRVGENREEVWKTVATSTGSSPDLRRVMPVLVASLRKHLATDTKTMIEYTVPENHHAVAEIRSAATEVP